MKKVFFKYEWFVLLGGILGIMLGVSSPDITMAIAPIGSIFVSVLKVMIYPFVFLSILLSFMKMNRGSELLKLGLGTLSYYILTSALACILGLFCANLFVVCQIDYNLFQGIYNENSYSALTIDRILAGLFSFKEGGPSILQLVLISCFLGIASLFLPLKIKKQSTKVIDTAFNIGLRGLHLFLWTAPFAICALVAKTIATSKFEFLEEMSYFFLATLIAAFVHAIIILPLIGRFLGKFSPFEFFNQVKEALLFSLVTASSSATLPISLKCLEENAKVSKKNAGLVASLGSTINMDGSALYQSILVVFMASLSGLQLDLAQQLMIFIYIMFSSAGTAGIPGGGIMMMGMALEFLGLPLDLIGLYMLVDRFWDYPITTINVWGDLIGAKLIDRYL